MKIFLRGAYNHYNFGDDILLAANLLFIEDHLSLDGKCVVYLQPHEHSFNKLGIQSNLPLYNGIDIESIVKIVNLALKSKKIHKSLRYFVIFIYIIALFLNIIIFRIAKFRLIYRTFITFYENLNVIHYIGGGYINDRWKLRLLYEYLTLQAAKLINPQIFVIGTGLGLGPFNSRFYTAICKRFLHLFDHLFLREMKSYHLTKQFAPAIPAECLGDDVLLLLPILDEIFREVEKDKIIAINLKNFPDHTYSNVLNALDIVFQRASQGGFAPHYFCFGEYPGPDDYALLENYPQLKGKMKYIHYPYQEGFQQFMKNLARAKIGIGFAYHFNVVLALLSIPSIAIYQGDYYKQKIAGVLLASMMSSYLVANVDEFNTRVDGFIEHAFGLANEASKDRVKLENAYENMVSAYKQVYQRAIEKFRISYDCIRPH